MSKFRLNFFEKFWNIVTVQSYFPAIMQVMVFNFTKEREPGKSQYTIDKIPSGTESETENPEDKL